MDNKHLLALRKQLKREQLHVQWLEQHLPNSRQLNSAQQRVAQLCVLKCVVESAALPTTNAAKKRATPKRRSLFGVKYISTKVAGFRYTNLTKL